MKRLLGRLFAPVCMIAAAFLGYFLTKLSLGQADIRGGLLLLCPFFICFLIAAFFSVTASHSFREGPKPDWEIVALVRSMAEKAGMPVPEIGLHRTGGESSKSAVFYVFEILTIWKKPWDVLPYSSREFVVARHFAEQRRLQSWQFRSAWMTVAIVGSAIACYNLWLILALQFGVTVVTMFVNRGGERRVKEVDAASVRLTGDLEGAIRYLRTVDSKDREVRIRHLQKVFAP